MSHTYQNGKPKTYCTSINITPRVESQVQNSAKNGANNGTQDRTPFGNSSESLLVASVEGKSVGGGPGVLYSAINGNPGQGSNGPKVNPSDPQVRKLVYNMYRGLLNTKHERANNIVEAAPEENVVTDEGVGERVISMMRHRTEQREGKMMNLGPPPPPPPPPFSTGAPAPAPKPPAEVPSKAPPPVAIPAALAGAMLKDKKPFTYTPGGLNLAEIKSPRMQRRLQRNASMEGVRPSPLAQQPPQSPGHSAAATIPTHGMIQVQVLPMPGMGMTPVVRPQPKEPPKPKRNVCGPAPPPPPFSITGENSNEPSPSATPLTTPATTPASSSGISSGATSALSSQSTAPASNSHSLETDEQSTKDKTDMAAELGSNIPSPPPPPPTTASHKRYSLPPLSSQQSSSSSRPESESLQSSLSTFSPPYTASQFSNDLTQNEKDDLLVDVLTPNEKSKSKTKEKNDITPLHDNDQVKQEVSNETVENTKLVSSSNHERELKGTAEIDVENKQTSAEIPIIEDITKNNDVKLNSDMNLINKMESEILEKSDPQAKLETKAIGVENCNLNFGNSEENTTQSKGSLSPIKTFVHDNTPTKHNALNEIQVSSFASTINVPLEKVKDTDSKVSQKTIESIQNTTSINSQTHEPTPLTEIRNRNSLPVERVSAEVVENKPSAKMKENQQNITSITFQPYRPNVRMASPPTEVKKSQNANYDRITRQASLPAEATSPQAHANKGSIYIPPVRQTSSDSTGQSKSASQSSQCPSSSPTGLNKGPLPWMCGVRKESSPPPEFLIYAQKAQDRIQRQRSLTQQDKNQQYFDSQRNDTRNLQQNGYFQPSSPYSSTPNISMSKETNNNNEPQLQYNWRLPAHQSGLKNPQNSKLQQTQQQKSNLQNFNQPQTPQGRQTQQPRFSQFSQQQSMTLPKNLPRERIIPIMMEDSSSIIPTSNIYMTGGTNNFQNKMNNSYQHFPQRQQSWSKPSSVPSSPMGTSVAFSPFDEANYHSSSNALEALQQMQQNLAKLNCGLETAQTPAQQNGAPFVIQHTGGHDPVQSRSFKILQNAYDHQEPSGPPIEVPPPAPEPKKYAGSHIPSRSFRMLQTMTDDGPGPGESDL